MSGNAGVDSSGDFYPIDPTLPIDHIHEDEDEIVSPCCWDEINDMWLCSECLEHIL